MDGVVVALATAWGESGIAIVRMSGGGSLSLADALFCGRKKLSEFPPRFMALGVLRGPSGDVFDEALAVRFEAGGSYTGEESVEFQCHGGLLPAQKCVEALCALGAEPAAPGEFTKRAFINGRIDLSQAEAVLGIIKAGSDEALRASARTLQGGFSKEIRALLDGFTAFAAQLEVDLDFPEEGEGFLTRGAKAGLMEKLAAQSGELLERCRAGLLLREGVSAAIVGSTNVGKSSLLNALLKEKRAIVTPVPGTTRDRIEGTFIHRGVPVRITDTAGIRSTSDEVESIGVEQSMRSLDECDVSVFVIDSGVALSEAEIRLGRRIEKRPHIIILNKSDLPAAVTKGELSALFPSSEVLAVSALTSEGTEEIKDSILRQVSAGCLEGGYGVTSRQMECLASALGSVKEARSALERGLGDDVVISCVAEARRSLSSLLGLDASEELADAVFSSFCVGK